MSISDFDEFLTRALRSRDAAHQLRARRMLRVVDATHVEVDGRRVVNFASNDYLGLTHHPQVVGAIQDAASQFGAGSGGSAMVTGRSEAHASAERAIARWKGVESAVLLPSGYQANLAAVQAITGAAKISGQRVRFLLDKLVHASLIDAVQSAGAPYRVFPHNNLSKLERFLTDRQAADLQVVITESIFSMDGDVADLEGLASLKRRLPFVLLLDEAHASGVYGANGAGYAAERGLREVVDVGVVTFSKATGIAGGAVCGSNALCSAIANFGRAYIYSTSVAPSTAAGIEAAIGVLHREPERQLRLRGLALDVRRALRSCKVKVPAGDSPIIPIIFGSEAKAVAEAERLLESCLLIAPIRPPTVARGSSRLRVTLSSEHTDDDIASLIAQAVRWAQ